MIRHFEITDSCLKWLENILAERLGHKWHLTNSAEGFQLRLEGAEGSIFFPPTFPSFMQARSDLPFSEWRAESEGWQSPFKRPIPAPGMVGLSIPLIERRGGDSYYMGYDIFGLSYWMLARVEEIGRQDLDEHDRFPATSSHAFRCAYLDRPVVDEWFHILRQVVERQWPALELKQHEFKLRVSHDVDQPSSSAFTSWPLILKTMASQLLKHFNIRELIRTPYIKLVTHRELCRLDPFNTFEWLMDISEIKNIKSTFNFVCGKTHRKYDPNYDIDHPAILNLMRRINLRGHEIGLHPSYNTYKNPELLTEEAQRLKKICKSLGVKQTSLSGRMHYLRWQPGITHRAMTDAGIEYDSTLGYADLPGFRCGTCYEYNSFDPLCQEEMNLRIRPLIVMEDTVLENQGVDEAYEVMKNLRERCELVSGTFELLWHNSYLHKKEFKKLYAALL